MYYIFNWLYYPENTLFIMLTYIDKYCCTRHSYVGSEATADDRLAKRFLRNLSTMTYDRHRNTGITPCINTKHMSGKCIYVKESFTTRVNQYPTCTCVAP